MKSLIKWVFKHRHKWETTHINRFGHPSRQVCRCGISREVKIGTQRLACYWSYSDGSKGDEAPLGEQK